MPLNKRGMGIIGTKTNLSIPVTLTTIFIACVRPHIFKGGELDAHSASGLSTRIAITALTAIAYCVRTQVFKRED